jgi:hypothetical protein
MFTATPAAASIPARGQRTVSLQLEAGRLGRIQLPVYVKVAGSRNKPLQLVADAKAVGPWLELAVMPAPAAAVEAAAEPPAAAVAGGGDTAEAAGAGSTCDGSGSESAGVLPSEAGSQQEQQEQDVEASSSSGGNAGSTAPAAAGGLQAEASSASALTSITTASGVRRKMGRTRRKQEPAAPRWAGGAAIAFDKVQVLTPHSQQLLLRNPTLIDSEVKLFVEGRDSVFEVRG